MTCAPFTSHDHTACVAETLTRVERLCAERGLQLTPARRRVLKLLLDAPKAQGAYDILAALRAEGGNAQPPVAYRALDFLCAHGFAHRLEKLNAYVACPDPGAPHLPAFLICRACDGVAETPDPAPPKLNAAAEARGFTIERTVIEAVGLCPDCAGASA